MAPLATADSIASGASDPEAAGDKNLVLKPNGHLACIVVQGIVRHFE
ncbi:hypothetical protein [Sphaerochaeta sp. PS]|nr:hypothetical protein [Sphaerochaeta sp. PS]MDT4761797.1 hypothetical protein [Sphaerochaeta sp. PS]